LHLDLFRGDKGYKNFLIISEIRRITISQPIASYVFKIY
jgi:hypothetical protein